MFDNYSDLIGVEEMQEILNIGKNTAYKLLNSQEIKGFRIGKTWKIPKKSLEVYVMESTHL